MATETANLTINYDLRCVRCGYNLRTLARDAVCPECALPVRDSVRSTSLQLTLSSIPSLRRALSLWIWFAFAQALILVVVPLGFLYSLQLDRAGWGWVFFWTANLWSCGTQLSLVLLGLSGFLIGSSF